MPELNEKQDFEVDTNLEAKIQEHLDDVPDPTKEDFDDIPQRSSKKKDGVDDELKGKEEEENDDDLDLDLDLDDDEEKEDDKPVLPENYFRAARHSDWSEDEIQEFFDSNPEVALKTFKKIYESTNAATEEFVKFGRLSQKQTQDALEAEQAKKDAEANKFKGMDLDAIEKQYREENPAVVTLLKAADEQNRQLHEANVELKKSGKQSTKQNLSNEDSQIFTDIENFFGGEDLEAYNGFYGETEKDQPWTQVLTGVQMQRRMDVVVMADEIRAGAKLRGAEMERGEALRRAHLAASDEIRDTVVRESLKGKLKKRSSGITVKTTGRKPKNSETTPEKMTEKRVEKRAGGRLRKLWPGSR